MVSLPRVACKPKLPPVLLTGDTLFALGCGRLFEGTPQQMWTSLSKLTPLPPETQASDETQAVALATVATTKLATKSNALQSVLLHTRA